MINRIKTAQTVNQISTDAKVNETFFMNGKFWIIARNWCGVVFATQIDSTGMITETGDEIIIRKDW